MLGAACWVEVETVYWREILGIYVVFVKDSET